MTDSLLVARVDSVVTTAIAEAAGSQFRATLAGALLAAVFGILASEFQAWRANGRKKRSIASALVFELAECKSYCDSIVKSHGAASMAYPCEVLDEFSRYNTLYRPETVASLRDCRTDMRRLRERHDKGHNPGAVGKQAARVLEAVKRADAALRREVPGLPGEPLSEGG